RRRPRVSADGEGAPARRHVLKLGEPQLEPEGPHQLHVGDEGDPPGEGGALVAGGGAVESPLDGGAQPEASALTERCEISPAEEHARRTGGAETDLEGASHLERGVRGEGPPTSERDLADHAAASPRVVQRDRAEAERGLNHRGRKWPGARGIFGRVS